MFALHRALKYLTTQTHLTFNNCQLLPALFHLYCCFADFAIYTLVVLALMIVYLYLITANDFLDYRTWGFGTCSDAAVTVGAVVTGLFMLLSGSALIMRAYRVGLAVYQRTTVTTSPDTIRAMLELEASQIQPVCALLNNYILLACLWILASIAVVHYKEIAVRKSRQLSRVIAVFMSIWFVLALTLPSADSAMAAAGAPLTHPTWRLALAIVHYLPLAILVLTVFLVALWFDSIGALNGMSLPRWFHQASQVSIAVLLITTAVFSYFAIQGQASNAFWQVKHLLLYVIASQIPSSVASDFSSLADWSMLIGVNSCFGFRVRGGTG
ncbi:hypothetical protein JW859_14800 [bacterium]|nr:hypothetical protein [bacterium]